MLTQYKSYKICTIILTITCISTACYRDSDTRRNLKSTQTFNSEKEVSKQRIIVDIVPFDDMPTGLTSYFFNQFIKVHPSAKLHHPIPLPKSAYYIARDRYRADSLIRQLSTITPDGHVTLALTTKRISTTKGNIKDWGIIGLGYCPGKSCIVSTSLLHKINLKEQLFKVAIHELAHTQGLDHCNSACCYMSDAKGKNIVDQGMDFCPACKEFLRKKGWIFK